MFGPHNLTNTATVLKKHTTGMILHWIPGKYLEGDKKKLGSPRFVMDWPSERVYSFVAPAALNTHQTRTWSEYIWCILMFSVPQHTLVPSNVNIVRVMAHEHIDTYWSTHCTWCVWLWCLQFFRTYSTWCGGIFNLTTNIHKAPDLLDAASHCSSSQQVIMSKENVW